MEASKHPPTLGCWPPVSEFPGSCPGHKPMALKFWIELNLEILVFENGRKMGLVDGNPRSKTFQDRELSQVRIFDDHLLPPVHRGFFLLVFSRNKRKGPPEIVHLYLVMWVHFSITA